MNPSLKTKLIVGFIIAFLAGGAAGAFLTFHQLRHWRTDFGRHPHALTDRMRDRIQTQLDLTSDQLKKIEPILNGATEQLQKIRHETGVKVREVMAQTNQALEPELTAEQRERLAHIQKSDREHKKGMRHRKTRGDGRSSDPPDRPPPAPSL
ncbi:MAG: hypothetical protein ACR2G0_00045 [Chthoniobacterales bacterium]